MPCIQAVWVERNRNSGGADAGRRYSQFDDLSVPAKKNCLHSPRSTVGLMIYRYQQKKNCLQSPVSRLDSAGVSYIRPPVPSPHFLPPPHYTYYCVLEYLRN